jgi:hypothetical protein
VGQEIDTIKALIAEHLGGIPNSHLYDGLTSIYDLARQCFGGTIALREHFRCVPDIIEFSNRLSYDGEIRPLRSPDTALRPHVVEYVVDAGTVSGREGKTNFAEARVVAALVKAVTELPEYAGKTIGAITLLGDEQAALIQDLTVGLVGAVELDHRRFVAGNSAQFQGDERHVVFLGCTPDDRVDAPGPARPTVRLVRLRFEAAQSPPRPPLSVADWTNQLRGVRDLALGFGGQGSPCLSVCRRRPARGTRVFHQREPIPCARHQYRRSSDREDLHDAARASPSHAARGRGVRPRGCPAT